jgi:hypothetical protein
MHGVHGLPLALYHALLHTLAQHPGKEFFEHLLAIKPTCTTDRGMPGQWLIQFIADEVQQVQPEAHRLNNSAVTEQVLEVAIKMSLKKTTGSMDLCPSVP